MLYIEAEWKCRGGFICVYTNRPGGGGPWQLATVRAKNSGGCSGQVHYCHCLLGTQDSGKVQHCTLKNFHQAASSKQLSISESVSRGLISFPLKDSLPSGPLDGFELLWLKEFGHQKSIELHFYEIIDKLLGKPRGEIPAQVLKTHAETLN